MKTNDFFHKLLDNRKIGIPQGIPSICSANRFVLEAAMEEAIKRNAPLLIEATANQVNQLGGYTGMTPADFARYVMDLAESCGFPAEQIMLGGDHLGPLVWRDKPESEAMELAAEMVAAYVEAGFTKIHLDTSMSLAGDELPLSDECIALRGAFLCRTSEEAWRRRTAHFPNASPPIYVIGSEVPVPGGSSEVDDELVVTSPNAFLKSREAFNKAFEKSGLSETLKRVVAFVVQPGVEFNGEGVFTYNRHKAASLMAARDPDMVFEGHSTDYQLPGALRQMVEDGVAILKVGPALTFACREALMGLEYMERELIPLKSQSGFTTALDEAMESNSRYWAAYYDGTEREQRIARHYSYLDRCRYYLGEPRVVAAIEKLISNLRKAPPQANMVSQFLPGSYEMVRSGEITLEPEALVRGHIRRCVGIYYDATDGGKHYI